MGSGEQLLEVKNVTKVYEGFTLRDVSFSLPQGYIMGLIGHNGAGKTTLLSLILNLVHLDAGEIRVFGLDHRIDEVAVRSRIGFVHEVPTFFGSLAVERAAQVVSRFYPSWDEAGFREVAGEFGLAPGKKLGRLSQGMRTRFALAVALSHGAELLLLDEPSSGLDPAFRRDLLERLSGVIRGGRTSVLFSTHITSDLDRIADYVTFLRQGRLVFSTTREEVLERWFLVKGGSESLNDRTRSLFAGVVTGEYGFTGLTERLPELKSQLAEGAVMAEPANLEDVVYYMGRTGKEGIRLHGRSR
jgi:ABC-2 type transport system ATP-binding protein